jgi:hypothetical protein
MNMQAASIKKVGIRILVGSLSLAAMFLAFVSLPEQAGASFEYAAPLPSYCVSGFSDSQLYGWWAYQNNCGRPIHLTWYGRISGGLFAGDIQPGGKANTGFSPAEVNQMGGFNLFICPINYIPVDSTGTQVSSPYASYQCSRD